MEPVINEGHLVASPHPSWNPFGRECPNPLPGMGIQEGQLRLLLASRAAKAGLFPRRLQKCLHCPRGCPWTGLGLGDGLLFKAPAPWEIHARISYSSKVDTRGKWNRSGGPFSRHEACRGSEAQSVKPSLSQPAGRKS